MEFLKSNLITIILVLGALGYIGYLCITRQWAKLRKHAHDFMNNAEIIFSESKQGQKRMEWVLDRVYWMLPGWLKIFVSRKRMQEILQKWYNMLQKALEEDKL